MARHSTPAIIENEELLTRFDTWLHYHCENTIRILTLLLTMIP